MAKTPQYHAANHIDTASDADPYLSPAFTLQNRIGRVLWAACWLLLYRPSPRPLHAWRSLLLRIFGATMGPNCHFYPGSRVWAPWNLICADQVTAANGAEIYNPVPMHFGSHAILSQDAYLCGATHDYDDPAFPLIAFSMTVGAYAWICARASVGPGVQVGEGAVLGLGAVATRSLDPWTIYGGSPAARIKQRVQTHPSETSSNIADAPEA
ncbi:acetyltransferase [Terriglobus saanensis]|uniref:Putative acetyltransferase n=1 Tax=Terriglobus saanensis (strain ATCC BAA-1853 / DSM 23119 / SP1PR4) TaxID=401053 RepID=E8V8K1_TERSS|nr:acetyltransferase [Terriglobus saanensis]ADV82980.1 putative acetyltransferase [Terriglobus saanensis SP1PR4]